MVDEHNHDQYHTVSTSPAQYRQARFEATITLPSITWASCTVTNCTLTLTNGVALGYYTNQCIGLDNDSQLVSQGSPTERNIFVYYSLVQEQPVALSGTNYPTGAAPIVNYHLDASESPSIYLRLTSIYAAQTELNVLYTDSEYHNVDNITARDCETYGPGAGWWLSWQAGAVNLDNNLFQYTQFEEDYCGGYFRRI